MTRGEFKDGGVTVSDASQKTDSAPAGDSGGVKDSGGGQDAGMDVGTQADIFTGAGAYASNLPGTSAVQNHMNNGVGVTPGLGVDCLSCHNGAAKTFLFAGTIFQDKAGTMPAADVEVRVVGSDNMGYSTHSDSEGNFWFLKGATAIAFPAMTGARDATMKVFMTGNITAANCNGCHDKNTTDPLHIP